MAMPHRLIKTSEGIQQAADVAAGVSVTSAGWVWLAHLNEILTTIGALVAIASGIYSIYLRRKANEKNE